MTTTAPATLTTTETPGAQSNDAIISLPNGVAVRPLKLSDVPVFARAGNNKKIWDNLRNRMPHPYTEEAARWWISFTSEEANLQRSGEWTEETGSQGPAVHTGYAITINDEAVGSIGLDFGTDVYFRKAEVGYWLSEEHWGKGIMGAVVPAFVQWAWRTFGILVRLEAEIYERNVGSRRIVEKAGFVEEGRRKCALVKNGMLLDAVLYGLLRPGIG